jgi:hypothetical protein
MFKGKNSLENKKYIKIDNNIKSNIKIKYNNINNKLR